MPSQNATPRFFSPTDVTTFIAKIWLPAMLFAAAVLICLPPVRPVGLALGAFLGIFALSAFWSVVLVSPQQGHLLYRRFLRWKRLEYGDVARCGRALVFPGLYYLKLRDYEPPLGKLYYIPYTPGSGPWRRAKLGRELMEEIRARIVREAAGHPDSHPERREAVATSAAASADLHCGPAISR